MDAILGNLYNELMCLCEVRGELSPEDNARVEDAILALQLKIEKLEKSSLWIFTQKSFKKSVDLFSKLGIMGT